ncbi:hypothetical protein M3J09_004178 [Ascochyta lentis]
MRPRTDAEFRAHAQLVGLTRSSAPVKGRTVSTARLRAENVCIFCLAKTD